MNSCLRGVVAIATLVLSGCQIPAAMIATGAGAMPAYEAPPRPTYDVPPQKIYAIDNKRYFTLENYSGCGGSQIYYNDTNAQIRTLVKGAISAFPGKLLIDGNSDSLIFPSSPVDGTGLCGSERGCFLMIYYSLDGGRTFDWFHPRKLSVDRKESYEKAKKITVVQKGRQLYVGDDSYATKYSLHRGIMGGAEIVEGGLKGVPHVQTPSGQDHITCDDSIRPKELRK